MFISKSFSIRGTILILNVFISSNDHCTVEVTFHVVRKIKKEPRRGSRINTDRFPKQGGVPGHAFPGNTIGFNSPKSPYLGF